MQKNLYERKDDLLSKRKKLDDEIQKLNREIRKQEQKVRQEEINILGTAVYQFIVEECERPVSENDVTSILETLRHAGYR